VYLVGSYYKKPGWNYPNKWGWCEIWIHVRIEKIVVEFHFTNNLKQKRKIKQQTKRKKKSKQAYTKVDLDLDDS